MKRVEFTDFYAACAKRLTEDQLKALNPYVMYYMVNGAYIGLEYYAGLNAIYISIAVGNRKEWWRDFHKWACGYKVKTVFFCAPEDRGTKAFALYAKGTLEAHEKPGYLLCRVELNNKRFSHG